MIIVNKSFVKKWTEREEQFNITYFYHQHVNHMPVYFTLGNVISSLVASV